jgi:integrase
MELRSLQATLHQRWPKLPRDEAERWLLRYSEKRSPYSRVRVHAIHLQLDCVISLALHLGLRRGEIFRARAHDIDPDNFGAVAWDATHSAEKAREVPWTSAAHSAAAQRIECRSYLGAGHDRAWLNLHAGPTAHLPMTRATFDKLLTTYLGGEWTFRRLRCTGAAAWARCGLPLERLRELLGLARLQEVLPYAQLSITGSLDRDMSRLNGPFLNLVQPGAGWSNRPAEADLAA